MNHSKRLCACLAALMMLSSCAAQAGTTSAPQPTVTPQPTPEPYTGPLYQIEPVNLDELYPSSVYFLDTGHSAKPPYVAYTKGTVLGGLTKTMVRGADDIYLNEQFEVVDTSSWGELQRIGVTGDYTVLVKDLFNAENFWLADSTGAIVYESPENIHLLDSEDALPTIIFGENNADGGIAVVDSSTGQEGLFNTETMKVTLLPEEYSIKYFSVPACSALPHFNENMHRAMYNGTIPVCYAASDSFFCIITNDVNSQYHYAVPHMAGIMDMNGDFVVEFGQVPGLEDRMVIHSTALTKKGLCYLEALPQEYTNTVVGSFSDVLSTEDRYYSLDANTLTLTQMTPEEYFEAERTMDGTNHPYEYNTFVYQAERCLIRDDLVLFWNEDTEEYDLMDANGTLYDFDLLQNEVVTEGYVMVGEDESTKIFTGDLMYNVQCSVIGNGTVVLWVNNHTEDGDHEITEYYLKITDIRPDGFQPDLTDFETDTLRVWDPTPEYYFDPYQN